MTVMTQNQYVIIFTIACELSTSVSVKQTI